MIVGVGDVNYCRYEKHYFRDQKIIEYVIHDVFSPLNLVFQFTVWYVY